MIEEITKRILEGGAATVEEALKLNEMYDTDTLCAAADKVREVRCGHSIDTCSIVNARSGRCPENCKWCAQSGHYKTGITEYDAIPADKALAAALSNASRGVKRFSLVTSGRKVRADQIKYFCDIYREIGKRSDIFLCASMGLLNREEMQALADAGVRRYHCNLETSARFFPKLCTTHTQADKLKTIAYARECGMQVCSGGIIGMGETLQDRLELATEAVAAGASSIPVNILQPIKGTPLENEAPLSDDEIIRSVALMRLVAPAAELRFAGGRSRLSQETTEKILHGGMNGALVGDMLTTVGNTLSEDYALFKRMGYSID